VLLLGVAGLAWYNQAMLAADVDHLYRHVLASGDPAAAHANADLRFQAAYPREFFLHYADQHPGLFDRSRLRGVEVVWMADGGQLIIVVKIRVDGDPTLSEATFYCRHTDNSEYRLLGIAPDLMAAVPKNLQPFSSSGARKIRRG
jgi:hypothetical protein